MEYFVVIAVSAFIVFGAALLPVFHDREPPFMVPWQASAFVASLIFVFSGGVLLIVRSGGGWAHVLLTIPILLILIIWPVYSARKLWDLRQTWSQRLSSKPAVFGLVFVIQVVPVALIYAALRGGYSDWLNEGNYKIYLDPQSGEWSLR